MIFSDLQQQIVDRLLWDAWFTEPARKVAVIPQVSLDIKTEWKTALLKASGAVVLVNTIGCKPTERQDLVDLPLILQISENVTLNRGKTGSQKPGADIGSKCMSLLRGWSPNEDLFAPFLLWGDGLSYLGEEDDSIDHWVLELRSQTMLVTQVTGIGDEGGVLADEQGRVLINSPTPA